MLVSLSGAAKVAIELGSPHVKIDCGIKIKAEGLSLDGGYIIRPSQLRVADVPKLYVEHLKRAIVVRNDGKFFYDVCCIRPKFVIDYDK